ncbi:MAG: large-conductance mechanosensitive channel [Planctomycetaceae bacterium]|jgi:large-conductance mechanosensitive channel
MHRFWFLFGVQLTERVSMTQRTNRLRSIGRWLTAANAVATLGCMGVLFVPTIFSGPAATEILTGILLAVALIVCSEVPHLLFWWLLRRDRSKITSITSVVVEGLSAVVLLHAFLLRPDPQNALILLLLPFLQLIGFAITLMVDATSAHIQSRDETTTRWAVVKFRLLQFVLVAFFVFVVWWLIQRPSNDRQWESNLAKMPRITFDENTVTIQSIRNTEYRSAENYTAVYYDETFDLRRIQSVEFAVVPFKNAEAAAHTFLIFGFEDGERLAISVEVRREREESYTPLKGLLRQFELTYVIMHERDAILLRTKYRGDRVYLYPTKTSQKTVRAIFESMLRRTNELRTQPEFYNTLTNNCSTSILLHYNLVNDRKLPASLKVLFSGYSDELVYELGLIASQLPFERLRQSSEITEKANRFAEAADFSQRIRE